VVLAVWQPWQWPASAWSALTFLMLVIAAILTWRQVKEAERAREELVSSNLTPAAPRAGTGVPALSVPIVSPQ